MYKRQVNKAGLSSENLESVRRWLQGQLAAQEYAKLGQGGHTNTEVPLRRVFIDLPVTEYTGETEEPDARVPFLASILSAKPIRLKNALRNERMVEITNSKLSEISRTEFRKIRSGHREKSNLFSANILIGGPGQGKSTLGQLACQIHRAELLKPFLSKLNTTDRELVQSFCLTEDQENSTDGLGRPRVLMLPLQISLPDLAAWLSSDSDTYRVHPPSIIRFLASLDSAKECKLSANVLTALAIKLPILLVLDGFDEVGAHLMTGNG